MFVGNLLLALAWAELQASVTLANLFVGYVLGYLILLLLVRGGVLRESRYVGKVSMAVGLAAFFLRELVMANLRLARDVVAVRQNVRPGIIAVPLDATSDSEILLLTALINLTPGSVALDVSPDRKLLYVHAMYVDTADAARAEIKHGYERRVLLLLR
ncbi:MAG TPA: Na+/H+ antiporter subunit E [Longimicrobium sp.]|nr:Na+/H+ antiporter subunit E [Longimicrobium sp.]